MHKETARISFRGGVLSMPVTTPYEWELLFEQLDASVRLHQRVRLEVARRACVVTRELGAGACCAQCATRLPRLRYAHGAVTLCRRCALPDAA